MSLEHAASIIEISAGRVELNKFLCAIFTCNRPLWQHIVLPHLGPRCIFTTNYDELVELGYKRHAEVPDIICEDRHPVEGRLALFKPHGNLGQSNLAIGKGGLVITQFDYFEMISEYRRMLSRAMIGLGQSCVILAGYSFGDMDIGAELFRIRKQDDGTPWYTIFPRNDPQVRMMYANKFNIRQINATLEIFLEPSLPPKPCSDAAMQFPRPTVFGLKACAGSGSVGRSKATGFWSRTPPFPPPKLAFPCFSLAESGLFNGLRRIQIKFSPAPLKTRSGCKRRRVATQVNG
jgi:hypothetical protein